MRVSREQAGQNRERVLDAAAQLFRERGFAVSVAELMQAAGLTHGGFYGQFASKDDLMAQACARAIENSLATWRAAAENAPSDPLKELVSFYVSTSHRDDPGQGCAIAALGSEAARQVPAVRHVISDGIRAMLDTLAEVVAGKTAPARRQRAAATLASMVGAMVLSRALDDDALSQEILRAVRAA